jgi:hypothetical protein
MMKAKDWAAKFQAVPASEQPALEKYADLLKEFGIETAELMNNRTRASKDASLFPAADAAIREQKQKWSSLCGHVSDLKLEMFDAMLDIYCPSYRKMAVDHLKIKADADKKKQDDDPLKHRKPFQKK